MGKLDPNSSRPPYLQIADDLMASIRAGSWEPGDALPSYKALAGEYGVAIGTVKSAIAVLRDQSIVVTRHGTGTVVHPTLDVEKLPTRADQQPVAVQAGDLSEVLRLLNEINERLATIERQLPAS